jgi:hypothetical protein
MTKFSGNPSKPVKADEKRCMLYGLFCVVGAEEIGTYFAGSVRNCSHSCGHGAGMDAAAHAHRQWA